MDKILGISCCFGEILLTSEETFSDRAEYDNDAGCAATSQRAQFTLW